MTKCPNCGANYESGRKCEHCGSIVNPNYMETKPDVKKKPTGAIIAVLVVVAIVAGVIIKGAMPAPVLDYNGARKKLEGVYNKIGVQTVAPVKGSADLSVPDIREALPPIDKYPCQVESMAAETIEIFSSTEKAGTGVDGWLCEMAEGFNATAPTAGGLSAGVNIRGISSGVGYDYIASGKYMPDAFSPSNELWGKMLAARNINVTLAEKRLCGNVAGVLLSKAKNQTFIDQYGEVTVKNISEAVEKGGLAMGYTNPFASSAGLNYLVSTLCAFDAADPLSQTAVTAFEKFQKNVPFVAYTTIQMRDSAASGVLEGFILEYQTFENLPEIKRDYVFTPFGMRHDSPVYEIGELSETKKDILRQFIAYCLTAESQAAATSYGFNRLDEYAGTLYDLPDATVASAQKVWKEKKNAGADVAAVFVADVSGSMEGPRINQLKESLLQGSTYIGSNNYVGLVTFDHNVYLNLPLGKFDINQRALFAGTVDSLQPGGTTAMFDGIAAGLKMLADFKEQNPGVKPMLFVLTDGETNHGNTFERMEPIIRGMSVPVFTIGYEADVNILSRVSKINEAANINADTQDVVYTLGNLFNAQM